MKLDAMVAAARDGERFTLEQLLAMMTPIWEAIESSILEQAAADAVAAGFAEPAVRFVIEEQARLLREGRPARLETAKQMLEAGATQLQ